MTHTDPFSSATWPLMVYTQKSRTRQRVFVGLGAKVEIDVGSLLLVPQVSGPPVFRFKIKGEIPVVFLRGLITQLTKFYDDLDHYNPYTYSDFPSIVIGSGFHGLPAYTFQVGRCFDKHGAYFCDYKDRDPLVFLSRQEPRIVVVKNMYKALVSEFQRLLDRLEELLNVTPFTQWDHLLGA